ncbi:hypothetical protein ARZXY2_4931 (plasmid) [Arthrobacter sp. ZXY-2]|nr:hypothetical protein ARZXY2_4931 [Arthrobacter sp. ZXY-2]
MEATALVIADNRGGGPFLRSIRPGKQPPVGESPLDTVNPPP